MKPIQKALIAFAAVVILYYGLEKTGHLPGRLTQQAVVPDKIDLSEQNISTSDDDVQAVQMPSTAPSTSVRGPEIRVLTIPWNAGMGHHFAVGGAVTMTGSLMEKHGVKVRVTVQPDDNKALDQLVTLATQMAGGNDEPPTGAHFVIDMGDAMAQYLAACNKATAKLGDDYRCEIIGSAGFSRGEDKCMGLPEWKDSPEAMKGALIAGQLRQGDWNVCQFYEAQNTLKNNPDETTWDPDAVNWFSTDDFEKAAQAYIGHACLNLDVVKNGKKTGEKVNKCVNGVATWTPQDVEIAHKKGGLVSLLSTKENAYQMPATIIGIHAWDVKHAKLVTNYLGAVLEGGAQVRKFDAALQRAGKASYAIYKDQTPGYWVKYYKGTTETDKGTQLPIALGGSTVSTLDDNLCLFGLADSCGNLSSSMFNASYTGFGNIVKQQYPRILPSFPPVEQAVNTTFLMALANARPTKAGKADLVQFDDGEIQKNDIVAKRDWSIQFDTGKDLFSPVATATLDQLYNALLVGGALSVEIDGHTDNVGQSAQNLDLSRRRAVAVQRWLMDRAPAFFSKNRVSVQAFGDTMPKASNDTPDGRAQNRRVTIVLGVK